MINKPTAHQIIRWTIMAHEMRMKQGMDEPLTGAWWELLPEPERSAATQWALGLDGAFSEATK